MNIGIPKDSIIRTKAGINYTLMEVTNHTLLPTKLLIELAQKLLSIDEEILKNALSEEIADNTIIVKQKY